MNRSRFEQIFHAFRQTNIEDGKIGWENEISPYEVGAEVKDE
jgi:hypothetical protein